MVQVTRFFTVFTNAGLVQVVKEFGSTNNMMVAVGCELYNHMPICPVVPCVVRHCWCTEESRAQAVDFFTSVEHEVPKRRRFPQIELLLEFLHESFLSRQKVNQPVPRV